VRILIAIPHYYRPSAVAGAGSGSTGPDPEPRVEALTACLNSLRQLPHEIAVHIHVLSNDHILDRLPIKPWWITHIVNPIVQPGWLGFACQYELAAQLGYEFDYYCYMEDDLSILDPHFFNKLAGFNRDISPSGDAVLLPWRYETCLIDDGPIDIVQTHYIDADIPLETTRGFQDISIEPELKGLSDGLEIHFRRMPNPHAGCFFLTRSQMQRWAGTPEFKSDMRRLTQGQSPACDFIGPLESAASLGVMRTFRVYKVEPKYPNFFEIKHYGTKYLDEFVRNQKPA
jgi:hypothetical protein